MKRAIIIMAMVMAFATLSMQEASAQFRVSDFDVERLADFDQYSLGQRQVATGTAILATTVFFDVIYYGVNYGISKKGSINPQQLKVNLWAGAAVTGVGALVGLCYALSGHRNIKQGQPKIHITNDGVLCIPFGCRW